MRSSGHATLTAQTGGPIQRAIGRWLAVIVVAVLAGCIAGPANPADEVGSPGRPSVPPAAVTVPPSAGASPESPSPSPTAPPTPSPSPSPSATPSPSLASIASYTTHGPRDRKWIALTFDADMYPWMYAKRNSVSLVDERIVDLLEATETPATIFLNGLFVQAYPDLVRRLADNPRIELANHSWDHAGWTADCPNTDPIRPPMTMEREVTDTEAIVEDLTGVKVRYFRFPGFCRTDAQVELVRSLGESSVGSDCYFGDSFGWSASRQVATVQANCRQGSIVVTHINGPPYHPNVYEALQELIPWWKANGWTLVTVGEMLGRPTR